MRGIVSRLLPQKSDDDSDNDKPIRLNRWKEPILPPTPASYHGLADEGSLMVATNPTISTGMLWVAAQVAFSDTAPNLYLYNAHPFLSIWLVFLKLIATQPATAATAVHYAAILDNVDRALSTDNTQYIMPVCPRSGLSLPIPFANAAKSGGSRLQVQNNATASVIAASSANARRVARGVLGGLNIAGDELQINFGSLDAGAQPATTAVEAAGQPGRRVSCEMPVIIDPQHSLALHLWMPGSSASINPELVLGMVAR